ncbi:MAG: hypothetical protein JOY99_16110 [Sphingomonadaceae bacterium]|nr:hypothetical protein [Sphingomonadaceae bacterium]
MGKLHQWLAACVAASTFLLCEPARAADVADEKAWPLATTSDFVFRGVTFGVHYDGPLEGIVCDRSRINPEEQDCTFKNYFFYEVPAVVGFEMYKGIPYDFELSTALVYSEDLLKAFYKKYGPPCVSDLHPKGKKAKTAMWCFRYAPLLFFVGGGKLPVTFSYTDIDVRKRYPKVLDF